MLYRVDLSPTSPYPLTIRATDTLPDDPDLGPGVETRATLEPADVATLKGWQLLQYTLGGDESYSTILDPEEGFDPETRTLHDTDKILAAFAILAELGSAGPIEWEGSSFAWLRHDLDHARYDAEVDTYARTVTLQVSPTDEIRAMRAAANPLTMASLGGPENPTKAAREAHAAAQSARAIFLDRWGQDYASAFDANLHTIGQIVASLDPGPISEAQSTVDGIVAEVVGEAIRSLIETVEPEAWDVTDLDDLFRHGPHERVTEACEGSLVYTRECEDLLLAFPEHADAWRDVWWEAETPDVDIRAALALERAVTERLGEAYEEERDKLTALIDDVTAATPPLMSAAYTLANAYQSTDTDKRREAMRAFLLRAHLDNA